MAHTFDIRFARSEGFAAMLAAPSNSFRWTGSGHLSIDAAGVSVALKRGLTSLLTRNRIRRIPAADLKEVFREGDALRVEFATQDSARASLRFWANDRDTAARIVQLLPTSRTVEFEEDAAGDGYRVNRRIATGLGLALAVIAGAIVVISLDRPRHPTGAEMAAFEPASLPVQATLPEATISAPQLAAAPAARAPQPPIGSASTAPAGTGDASETLPAMHAAAGGATTPASASTSDTTPAAIGAGLADLELQPALPDSSVSPVSPPALVPPATAAADPDVIPIPGDTLSWKRALRQLAVFGSESDDLLAEYDDYFNRFRTSQIRLAEFTLKLSNLEKRWWDVTNRILEAQDFADPLLVDLRATLLACARERRDFLTAFSKGTSTRDQKAITSALDHQARAVELNQRARRYID